MVATTRAAVLSARCKLHANSTWHDPCFVRAPVSFAGRWRLFFPRSKLHANYAVNFVDAVVDRVDGQ